MAALLSSGIVACQPETADKPTVIKPDTESDVAMSITDSLVTAADATELMRTKAVQLRNSTGVETGNTRSAAYVYSASRTKYADAPGKLAARLALLGFKDIYLSVSRTTLTAAPSDTEQQWARSFIAAAHNCGMKIYAMRLSSNRVYVSESALTDETASLGAYNSTVTATERFDGLSADLEPHTCKDGSDTYPAGLGYYWNSTTNYGVGKDNDILVCKTLDVLAKAKTEIAPLLLCEAVFSQFQPKYNAGLLSKGSATDFLKSCDWIMVMAYSNNKERVWESVKPFLTDSKTNKSITACIKVTQNGTDDATSLKSKGWNYTLQAVKYLRMQGSYYASFRGIDFFQYEGFEKMWEWVTDNGE